MAAVEIKLQVLAMATKGFGKEALAALKNVIIRHKGPMLPVQTATLPAIFYIPDYMHWYTPQYATLHAFSWNIS